MCCDTDLSLHRSADGDASSPKAAYHAMIKFILKDRQLFLCPTNDASEEDTIKFSWKENTQIADPRDFDRDGNALGDSPYATILCNFVQSYGGPHGALQWHHCVSGFQGFWNAACNLWGWPVVEGPADRAIVRKSAMSELWQDCELAVTTDEDRKRYSRGLV